MISVAIRSHRNHKKMMLFTEVVINPFCFARICAVQCDFSPSKVEKRMWQVVVVFRNCRSHVRRSCRHYDKFVFKDAVQFVRNAVHLNRTNI